MTDNELFALLRGEIVAGLARRGLAGWDVVRNYEPTQQGGSLGPLVLLNKIGGDRRIGSPQQKYEWVADSATMQATYYQRYESTIQVGILMDESTDPAAFTASDVLSMVCDIMQTDEGMAALRAQNVGVLPVKDLRNPYNVNDRGQYAAEPTFDLVVTYRRSRLATADYAVSVEGRINRV